jgi:DNA-binding LacI/PurR family transcriptional regulator
LSYVRDGAARALVSRHSERGVDGIALVGQRHMPEVYQLLRSRQLPYVGTVNLSAVFSRSTGQGVEITP